MTIYIEMEHRTADIGMIKIMENAGMHIEAVRAKQHIFSGEIVNTAHCSIFNKLS